jgi:hypothetical protein
MAAEQKYSLQDAIDEIRRILQDQDVVRYTAESVVQAVNVALGELRRQRPDLLASRNLASPTSPFPYSVGDELELLPIHPMYFMPIITYACGWLEMADDEFANTNRLTLLFTLFQQAVKDGD